MKTLGQRGFVCFLFFRKTNNYARKGTTIQASPGMSPWVHPGALPGHWYPPKVPAKGPRSAAEGAAQRRGQRNGVDIIPMSFRDIVPVRGYYPNVFSRHLPAGLAAVMSTDDQKGRPYKTGPWAGAQNLRHAESVTYTDYTDFLAVNLFF